ncbi:MAG: chloride channel protein [Bacteroidales bacterium]|nr:chloride channel protein [Bacteroidales bacterium]
MKIASRLSEKNLLLALSVVTGLVVGLAAVLLKTLIGLIQKGLGEVFGGLWNGAVYFIILPGAGMLLALLFCKFVIKDKIGHGVTKALQAISRHESRIKPHNMWSSVVASSLTIGFGGSVGAEAPIVYTGAAIGSNFARKAGLSYRNMTTLLGCGAAAAVAGIFKAPLAGVLFVLEILLFNTSMNSMMPLLLSTVSATVVSYIFLGRSTPFECALTPFNLANIPFYLILGLFCGACSIYFIRTTLWLEDKIGKINQPYLRWGLCAIGLGSLIFLFPQLHGEGYNSLGVLLNGHEFSLEGQTPLAFLSRSPWSVPVFFLLILLLKVFSMTLTNAGGGVGGTFGPTLFVGAIAGFFVARTMNLLMSGTSLSVPEQNFVLVGMAGLMAGVMQAPMTAIFLIAEISGGYDLFLPLILTATIAFGTTRLVEKYSIYTKRIAQRGELLTHDSDQAVLTLLKVSDVIETDFSPIKIDDTLGALVEVVSESSRNIFPVVDSKGRFQGYVSLEDIRKDMFRFEEYETAHVFNFMRSADEYVYDDENMDTVMRKFESTSAWNLPVVRRSDRAYIGFVSKSKIFSAYRDELKVFSQD